MTQLKKIAAISFISGIIMLGMGTIVSHAQTKGKKAPQIEKKPDLAINQIKLNKECFIVFTLVNRGDKGVPEHAYRNTPYKGKHPSKITVAFKGTKKSYLLAEVDPQKKLKNPHSSVRFKTPIKLTAKANVTVTADSNDAVKESKEIRNEKTENLEPTCMKTEKSTARPDLAVIKLGLDQTCHIVFTVENRGTAPVPKHAYARNPRNGEKPCKCVVTYKGTKKSFFLADVDPTAKLKTPHNFVTFTTPIKLSTTHEVKVKADSSNAIDELNDSNNELKKELTPKCFTAISPFKNKYNPPKTKSGTPKSVDEGIQISEPALGDAYMPGDRLTLIFQFRPDIDPIPITEILLYNGTTLVHTVPARRIPPPSRTMTARFRLPDSLVSGYNYSLVVRANDSIWGQSDHFRIGLLIAGTLQTVTPHGLRVTVEGNPSIVNRGEKINVKLEITNPDDPGFMAPSAYQSGYGFNIFVHTKYRDRDQMGMWYMPAWRILSRSEDYKALRVELTIGESWDEGNDYMVTYNHTASIYGDSALFAIRPSGVSEGSLNITAPTSDSILIKGQSAHIRYTLYDRDNDTGIYFFVELLKYRGIMDPVGRGKELRKPMVVHSETIAPISSSSRGGHLECTISYIPPEGTNSNHYRASGMGKNYRIRITAKERGDVKIASGLSDQFALLDTGKAMDIHVDSIKVAENGRLHVRYWIQCDESFSAPVPFTVKWPYHGKSTDISVPVTSGDDYVEADLGHIRDLKPATIDLPEATCRVTANKDKEFYELRENNNQTEARIPVVPKHVYFSFIGSDVSGNTFYYHDYVRFHCCESHAGFIISNAGYQTVNGQIEIHQTGNWDTGGGSGTLSPPYHDNHLVTWSYSIASGDRVRSAQIVQRSVLTGLRWTPSNLVFTFHGDFADFISPNPATKALRHRDGT